jgi:hypothetical protein
MSPANLPSLIGAGNSDFSKFIALGLSLPMTSAGGVDSMKFGVDCGPVGGCGTLLISSDFHPEVIGTTISEPSALLALGSSLAVFGTMLRRKLSRA